MQAMSTLTHEYFCNNVRTARLAIGLTQGRLAEKLQVSRPYIAQIEGGRRVPSLDIVERFADALGLKSHELLLPPKKFSAAS